MLWTRVVQVFFISGFVVVLWMTARMFIEDKEESK
tara:strand:- start:1410 stop:1514 length:105 start_codon:yes stop_codon:yes gene_type:complete